MNPEGANINLPPLAPVSETPPSGAAQNIVAVSPPASQTNTQTVNANQLNPMKKFLPLILIIILGVLVGAGSYFIINKMNTPRYVKEKTEIIQPIFNEFSQDIKLIADDLLDDSSKSDSDSLARAAQKSEGFLAGARANQSSLRPLVEKMNIAELKDYQTSLTAYMNKAGELMEIEKNGLSLVSLYVNPMKKYEELTLNSSGASNYMYSDPAKYVSIVSGLVEDENKILDDLNKIKPDAFFQVYHEAFIQTVKSEKNLLLEMKEAVEKRDSESINAAIKKYSAQTQINQKEGNRASDEIDNKIQKITDEIERLKERVNSEYDKLKGAYKF